MTIKIITKGVDPKTIPLRGACFNCKTTVECLQSDAKCHDSRNQRDSAYYSVICPVCNSNIYVSEYTHHDRRGPG